jgi:serpin B
MKMKMLSSALLLSGAIAACSSSAPPTAPPDHIAPGQLVRSSKARIENPGVPGETVQLLAGDNTAFAIDVLRASKPAGNFFFSPHSISIALAMTYGGARGTTHDQMKAALRFALPDSDLHPTFNALDVELTKRSQTAVDGGGHVFRLHVINSLWGQTGFHFLDGYLDLLGENYGAGLSLLDFATKPEESRQAINVWINDETERRIPELIPQGTIDSSTVLVLTNAIHFLASWERPFDAKDTGSGPFRRLDGTASQAPFMHQSAERPYGKGDDYEAVELDYVGGDVSMLAVLPAEGAFESFEASFANDRLQSIIAGLASKQVDLTFPKFSFRSAFGVKQALQTLGMVDAFAVGADFSGMDGAQDLLIQDVVHQAFVAVDEAGTEAAAATAVIVGRLSLPERATFTADHPFLFVIRDKPTGAVLFVGRVVEVAG